jgi:glycosyltransferase involved in cell wall biosynthesis
MFCSTIIPTVGRASLDSAVRSVLSQSFDPGEHEVIIVNDSGRPLPPADWFDSAAVRIIHMGRRRERSVARNTGAAIARGEYLHFLDDDDVLLPGALDEFSRVARTTDADWLYGSWQTVDNSGKLVDEFRPGLEGNIFALLVAGEGLPLQASLVHTQCFFDAGGFDPLMTEAEDRDLGRRLALMTSLAHVPNVVAQIRIGEQGSTTRWAQLAESDRWGREKALSAMGALRILRASASSPYLRGRVCRAYCASAVWNLERRSLSTAISRMFRAVSFAGADMLSTGFLRGLRTRIK